MTIGTVTLSSPASHCNRQPKAPGGAVSSKPEHSAIAARALAQRNRCAKRRIVSAVVGRETIDSGLSVYKNERSKEVRHSL